VPDLLYTAAHGIFRFGRSTLHELTRLFHLLAHIFAYLFTGFFTALGRIEKRRHPAGDSADEECCHMRTFHSFIFY